MTAIRSVATAATKLNRTFRGELLKPGDAGYEEARKVHNGLVDKRPALIARCRQTTDVADAIKLTQRLGLEVAVRGGGHNVAGRATIDGGVMIDLAPMKEIRVDPENRTVRAQGGVTWAELNREMQRYGLAVTGGVRLSRARPCLPINQPRPPPRVAPRSRCWSSAPRDKRYAPARTNNPTCFGPFAVAEATSAWRRAWNIGCIQ
jgi:hypothetical protein